MQDFIAITCEVVKWTVWIIALTVMVGAFALDRK